MFHSQLLNNKMQKTTLLLLCFIVTLLQGYVDTAASSIFTDRNPISRIAELTKRTLITHETAPQKAIKRTLTPNTVDTPDTIPFTPEMNVLTPDTPDTPDTKTKIPETKDTPDSSGFQFSGSGDDVGYSEIESGTLQPVRFVANPLSNISDNTGKFSVQWKPYNKNTSKIQVTGSNINTEMTAKELPKDAENKDMIAEELNAVLEQRKPGPKNASVDKTMLDFFFDRYRKKSNIATNAYSRKKRIFKNSFAKHLHGAVEKSMNAAKKQDLSFNENDITEGPVGNINGGGSMEGLGGDMHGYPTGMGAGAEPLGAFDKDSPNSAMENRGPQTVDDKSDSFGGENAARPFEGGAVGSITEGRSPSEMALLPASPNGLPPPAEAGPGFSNLFGGLVSAQPFPGSNSLPTAPAVSMSNSLSSIDDKANVQGDGEIAKMVRNSRLKQQQKDQLATISSPSPESELENPDDYEPKSGGEVDNKTVSGETSPIGLAVNDEFSNEEYVANKRRLQKQNQKKKNRFTSQPFKQLQRHKKHH